MRAHCRFELRLWKHTGLPGRESQMGSRSEGNMHDESSFLTVITG